MRLRGIGVRFKAIGEIPLEGRELRRLCLITLGVRKSLVRFSMSKGGAILGGGLQAIPPYKMDNLGLLPLLWIGG